MKKKEITKMEDVDAKLIELREKMRVSRFALMNGKTKNVKEQGNIRRSIARLETMKSAQKTK